MKKLILFLMFLCACARNPATGKREIVLVSESQEIAMGQESDVQAKEEYGVVDNAALQSYVQTMGRKLVAVSHRPNGRPCKGRGMRALKQAQRGSAAHLQRRSGRDVAVLEGRS